MSILSAIRTYMATYTSLVSGAPLWVNFLGTEPTQYCVQPLAGEIVLEEYINGSSLRAYPFAFQSVESTADDLERMANAGFYEELAAWFESKTKSGSLPTLASGKTSEEIFATGWGFLFQQSQSETGIYQIQCRLVFKQDA